MPIITKYLFVASMDVDSDKKEIFNEVYDTEHVPNLLKVSGVHAVTRIKGEPFAMSIGGARNKSRTRGHGIAPSTRSRGHTCSSARRGPRRLNWALAQPGPALHPQSAARALSGLLATGLRCAPEQQARETGLAARRLQRKWPPTSCSARPLQVAERAAVLDIVSDGRMDMGTGRSTTLIEMDGFQVDPEETRAQWEEAIAISTTTTRLRVSAATSTRPSCCASMGCCRSREPT